ncbi:hypothetical protein AALP_AA8G011300 [Arabis alpina]|uniref:Transmembrane protein n=1 Tax=Arabis alpina TaxID=50452 RepID=A0A087G479_ARAAL|nr:hypothetical protein AALP_AA8G011300 [Arabis alpina]
MEEEEEEQRLVWKLKVGVRFSSFNLKLNLQNRLSSWKLHRLSFLVRFRKHRLQIDSQSRPEDCVPKSKFRSFLRSLLLFKKRKRWVADSKKSIGCKDNNMDVTLGNRSLAFSNKALVCLGLVIIILSLIIIMPL